jgi:hypothetical protein
MEVIKISHLSQSSQKFLEFECINSSGAVSFKKCMCPLKDIQNFELSFLPLADSKAVRRRVGKKWLKGKIIFIFAIIFFSRVRFINQADSV